MKYSAAQDFRHIYLLSNELALKGKRHIDKLSAVGSYKLDWLLRHHSEAPITDAETWDRDEIDYLLEYFSMLTLAWLTGFLQKKDIGELKEECLRYLGIPAVKKYYTEHYVLLLPQLLSYGLENNLDLSIGKSENSGREFLAFHSLNQTIDNADTNQFLWFLDGGENDGYSLVDFRRVLRNPRRLFKILQTDPRKDDNALYESVRGFFDYLQFVDQFEAFLGQVENYRHRIVYWYYHEYWFSKIGTKLVHAVDAFFGALLQPGSTSPDTDIDPGEFIEYYNDLQKIVFKPREKEDFELFFREMMGRNAKF